MTKYFGTDGIRGLANLQPMTVETAVQLGKAIVATMPKQTPVFKALIGKDPRRSGYMFESAIAAGVNAMGGDVLFTGPMPTPALAHLATTMRCDAGVVISASHNPYHDNGIKIFDANGFKLNDKHEKKIENLLNNRDKIDALLDPHNIGRSRRIDDALGRYLTFLKMIFPRKLSLDGLKIVVDCANGAAYKVAPILFWELGAEIIPTGVQPDGYNINKGVGALHPEHCAQLVKEHNADLGITLDGDADRLILVDENANIVDGDYIMAILATNLAKTARLPENTLVTTVMSNLGLLKCLQKHQIKHITTQVGDRYVVDKMRELNLGLGGEQSGHIVITEHSTTGDGLIAALEVLSIMQQKKTTLSNLANIMQKMPQILINFPVPAKPPLDSLPLTSEIIRKIERKLGDNGRVLVRYSGTEPKCRVMLEGTNPQQLKNDAEAIAAVIKSEIPS